MSDNNTTTTTVEPKAIEVPENTSARMLPLMHDVRGQIARRTYALPLPLALCEELDKRYGKDAPAVLAEKIGPSIMALLNVTMPANAMTARLTADPLPPTVWATLNATVTGLNRAHIQVTRTTLAKKLAARIDGSTNKVLMSAAPARIEAAVKLALDTYFTQKGETTAN